jgi:CheY-like chemotaxis protein
VLVVDDDDKHLKSLAKALKPYEDRIDAQLVGDSVEALLRIGSHRPHLLILPVQMPKLDGVELCQQLREVPSTREIRVILVASQLDDELDKRARKAGASRLVVRPLDHEVVIREIGIA